MSIYKLGSISRVLSRSVLFSDYAIANRPVANNVRWFIRKAVSEQQQKPDRPYVRALINGLSVGMVGTAAYTVYTSYKSKNAHLVHERQQALIIDQLPDVKITRKVINTSDRTDLNLILFQYQTCPYCCKVRAFLDSSGLSYSVVEVDAVLRQGIKWSPYKKVPMLLAQTKDGKYVQLVESSMIISALSSYLSNPNADIVELANLYPSISYMNDDGKKTHDVLNKYFRMFGDKTPNDISKEELE